MEEKRQSKDSIFAEVCLFFVKAGLTKDRIEILKGHVTTHRGVSLSEFDNTQVTHIITSSTASLRSIEKEAGMTFESIDCQIVDADWISECLKSGKLLPITSYKRHFRNKKDIKPELPAPKNMVTPPPELYHSNEKKSDIDDAKTDIKSDSAVSTSSQAAITNYFSQLPSNSS